jgi:two-component system chemotaxis response regulator CheB
MASKKRESGKGDFPVVCVGGSAGGLDAYIRLVGCLPVDLGAAVVIVNHLRIVATQLHEILPRHTDMPVELITEGLNICPGRVFIIPSQCDLHVLDGEFRLKPISKPRGWPDVITVFLRSLAQHWSGQLIAVIVSGYEGSIRIDLWGASGLGRSEARQRQWKRCRSGRCLRECPTLPHGPPDTGRNDDAGDVVVLRVFGPGQSRERL